jgi:hypothetical protein
MQVNNLLEKLLSKKTKEKSERVILWIAVVSFIIHLLIIGLIHFNLISINEPSNLLRNPIAVSAILFGLSILFIHNKFEKKLAEESQGKNEIDD